MKHSGVVHQHQGRSAFEFGADPHDDLVVFVGGLFDELLTVPYLYDLSQKLQSVNWGLAQLILSSSAKGWGTSSLQQDNEEIAAFVRYFRSAAGGARKRIVLMGHSTGCQDTISYITKFRPGADEASRIDGGILQAPVSDREGFGPQVGFEKLDSLVETAAQLIEKGRPNELLPASHTDVVMGCPITAYRFHSLLSERGDDDYFSSYLSDKDLDASFGKINVPCAFLYGTKDEYVPASVDKQALLSRWQKATDPKYWSPQSKLVAGATHNCGPKSDAKALDILLDSVAEFVSSL